MPTKSFDVARQQWIGAPTKPTGGRVTVRVLLDRSQIEVWGNDGAVVFSEARSSRGDVAEIQAFADGGNAKLVDLKAYELKSIWE